jgi:hypothetical protein
VQRLLVVEAYPLLQVQAGLSQLSTPEQDGPQPQVGVHEAGSVLLTLGQSEELLPQLVRGLQPARSHVERPDAH